MVDEAHLCRLLDALGSTKVAELIEGVEAEMVPQREQLAAACARSDFAAARACAHAMTGVAASLGMAALADLCAAIETAAVGSEAKRVATLLERLDGAVAEGLACLRTLCGRMR
jgi:HPt (histidine-containing phosphotransfer) domain-containing protein